MDLDDVIETLASEGDAAVEPVGFGGVAQQHEHRTVPGDLGEADAGLDVDRSRREAPSYGGDPADLVEFLHPSTSGVLADRTGGGDQRQPPRQQIGEFVQQARIGPARSWARL